MDLSLLIVNIIAGALVGYITKTLAINMLFKSYPVIGGAEIIKDRENLGISISTLVEERLIRPSTLLEEFQKEEFKASFEILINHIIEATIYENIKELDKISEISGFHDTSEKLYNFLILNREKIMEPGIESLFDNVLIRDVLTKEQLKNLTEKFLIIFSVFIFNNEKLINNFIEEISEKRVNEVVSKKLLSRVLNNIIPENLHHILHNEFEKQIDEYIDIVYEILNFDTAIENIEISLKSKNLFELIRKTSDKNSLSQVIEQLTMFLNSEKGKIILNEFIEHLIDILKTLDIPLSSLLTEEIETKILQFVETHLPELLDSVEEWVASNKVEMENMVNSSIEEHLIESENLIKQIIGNIFVQKLAERYQIVESTIYELKIMAKKAGPNIINVANRFLDNTLISDLIKYIETNFLLDKKILSGLILELLNKYLPRINLSVFDTLFQKKLSDIEVINNLSIKNILKEQLYSNLKQKLKEQLLFNRELNSLVKKLIEKELNILIDKKVSELLTDKSNYKDIIFEFLSSDKFKNLAISKISEEVPQIIHDKTINQVITKDVKSDIYQKLGELYNSKAGSLLQILKNEKVLTIYKRTAQVYTDLCKNRFFSKHLTETLVNLMVKLIRDNKLLDGKIFIAIKESFTKFTDEELKYEMNSFMGKELQPIKLLGAFLGAVVGIAMYYISFIPGYGEYAKGYWALLSYSLSYAISEVGTNWLAIKMLFKPYEGVKIPLTNVNFPFTPGVFPKNKKALADSMVNFIDKKLLSKDNMVRILEKYHHKWKEVIKDVVSKNDYEVIDETINKYACENYDTVSPLLLELGFSEVNKNKDEIGGYLVEEVKNINFQESEFINIKKELSNKIEESNVSIKNILGEKLFDSNLGFGKELSQILPKQLFNEINNFVGKSIYEISKNIEEILSDNEKFRTFIFSVSSKVDDIIDNKLENLISRESINQNKNSVISFLENQLKNKELQHKLLRYLEEKFFDQGLSSQKEIGDLFDGKLISTVLTESDVIMDSLSNYVLNVSKEKKGELVKIILSDIEKKGLFESMLVRFGGIKNDVRGVIDVLIDRKLQPYLEIKKIELKNLFKGYIENSISKIRLYELGLTEEVFNIENIENILRKNVLNNQKIYDIWNNLSGAVIDDILKNLTIKEIIGTVNINSVADLIERFSDEVEIIRTGTLENLQVNNDKFVYQTRELAVSIFEKSVYGLSFNSLFKEIPKDEVISNINSLIDSVYKSESFKSLKEQFINDFFNKLNLNVSEILDYNILKRDLTNMIHELTEKNQEPNCRSTNFQTDIQNSVKDITISFVKVLNENIEKETKMVIEEILVSSLVDSLRINNREVLEPIDFDSIVRKEVHMMNASRIHSLFDFAKPIFRLLVWYGAMGGIIGLAVGIFEAFR